MNKIIYFFFLNIGLLAAQSKVDPCLTLLKINNLFQKNHYQPKPVDDSLSTYMFTNFLDRLDANKRLFTEDDLVKFNDFKYKIDDFISTNDCAFLEVLYQNYNRVVSRNTDFINELNTTNFPKSSAENIVFSKKNYPFLKNDIELKNYYKKRMLFSILREISEKSSNKDSLTTNFNSLFEIYKPIVFQKNICKMSNLKMTKEDFNEMFFSVFCSYFDPHSDYFSQKTKSSFFSHLSTDNLSFGFYVSKNDNDEIYIAEIIPASSAYRSGKIEKNDILLKITHQSTEYVADCISEEKLFEILNSDNYKMASFTFRKKSGLIYSLKLDKKAVKDILNNVYSFIITGDNKKYGYIKIPSFYAAFTNGSSTVSQDVAKEVTKLKEEKIDGLIIDLQNNGGGSMDEAIRLSGMFIDIGPVAVMNDRKNRREVLRDFTNGTIYSGNVIVLVNGLSASASEFFSNAMQDYKRAIIIGNTTLGKASMQQVIPIDDTQTNFVKITLEKFYRITGKSNQYIGLLPDVEIPSLFDKHIPREHTNKTALKGDEIVVSLKYKPLENDFSEVIEKSKIRLINSKICKEIEELNTKANPYYDSELPPIPLDFEHVFADVTKINSLWKDIKNFAEKEYSISLIQNQVDDKNQKQNDFLLTITEKRAKEARQNYPLQEAVNILTDLINN